MQATAQVIPFRFDTREVRTLLIDDQPWFVAMDVAEALQYTDAQAMTRRLDDDEVQNRQLVGFGNRGVAIINESGLYSAILRSRKAEAKRFKKWVTAEVLPAIRRQGHYQDGEGKLGTLIGQTIGTDGFHMLGAVVKGKVSHLPSAGQRRATAKLWSQVHAAFGVRSAADIPADQLDAARNFVAAYAIEGDYLARDAAPAQPPLPSQPMAVPGGEALVNYLWALCFYFVAIEKRLDDASCPELREYVTKGSELAHRLADSVSRGVRPDDGHSLTHQQMQQVWLVCYHFQQVNKVFQDYHMYDALKALGSPAGGKMIDRLRDGVTQANGLARQFEAEFRVIHDQLFQVGKGGHL